MGDSPASRPPLLAGTSSSTRSNRSTATSSRAEEALLASTSTSATANPPAGLPSSSSAHLRGGDGLLTSAASAASTGTHRRQRSLSTGSTYLRRRYSSSNLSSAAPAGPPGMASVLPGGHVGAGGSTFFEPGLYHSSYGVAFIGGNSSSSAGFTYSMAGSTPSARPSGAMRLPNSSNSNSNSSSASHPLGRNMRRGISQQHHTSENPNYLFPGSAAISPYDQLSISPLLSSSSSYTLSPAHASFLDPSSSAALAPSRHASASATRYPAVNPIDLGSFPPYQTSANPDSDSGYDNSLYVSPKLIMSGPSSSASASPSSIYMPAPYPHQRSQEESFLPLGSSSGPNHSDNSSAGTLRRRSSRSALSNSNSGLLSGGTGSTSSPLNTRSDRTVGFSTGMNVFDPDWELPSPITSSNMSGLGSQSANSAPMGPSRPGTMSSMDDLSAYQGSLERRSTVGGSLSQPYGDTAGMPSAMPQLPSYSGSYASSTTIYIPPYTTNSSLQSRSTSRGPTSNLSAFQYTGYTGDAGYASLASQTGLDSRLSGSGSTAGDPFSTSYSPRPSSEPLPASISQTPARASTLSSISSLHTGLSLGAPGYPDLAAGPSSLGSGYYPPQASRRGSTGNTLSPLSPRSGARLGARRPLTSSGLATSTFPSPLPALGPPTANSLPPFPGVNSPLSQFPSEMTGQGRSPRRLRSTGQLLSQHTSQMLPPLPDDGTSNGPAGGRSYGTRTRQNMQGLIHPSDVDSTFPGEWGGQFR